MRRKARTFTDLRLKLLFKFLLVALLFLAVSASAQDYRIRAKVDLVVIPVTVKAPGNELVTGLTKDDFVILEDGRPQTITNFSNDPVPLSAAVVVDTGLSAGSLSKIQDTFSALSGAFGENDEIAVYRYNRDVTKILDFSADIERVDIAMKTMRDLKPDIQAKETAPGGPFSIPGPVINGVAVLPPAMVGVPDPMSTKPSRVLNDALFTAASDLAKRAKNRRRMVIVISDGQNSRNDHSFKETSQRLLQNDIQVYAIGLDQPVPYKKFSVLDDYTRITGGDVHFAGSLQHIEKAYSAVTEEARNQYVLGYLSTNEPQGTEPVFREVKVQIASGNAKTLHRKGYDQYP